MSYEVQNSIISFIKDFINKGVKVIDISWYGGEPLMCLDVIESLARRIIDIIKLNKGSCTCL